MKGSLSEIAGSVVVALEQAAARNADPEAVAREHSVPVRTVLRCWDRMDDLARGLEVTDVRLPPLDELDRSAAQRRRREQEAMAS